MWLLVMVLNSSYSFYWDVEQDWDMPWLVQYGEWLVCMRVLHHSVHVCTPSSWTRLQMLSLQYAAVACPGCTSFTGLALCLQIASSALALSFAVFLCAVRGPESLAGIDRRLLLLLL